MNWFATLALVLIIAAAEYAPAQPVGNPLTRLFLVGIATAGAALFAWRCTRHIACERRERAESGLAASTSNIRWFERTRWSLWLALNGFIVWGAEWSRVVRFDWRLNSLPLVDDLLIVLPSFIALLAGWALSARLDTGAPSVSRGRYALTRLRDELGLALVPITLVVVASDVGAFLSRWTGMDAFRWLTYVVALGVLVVALPDILRCLWKTSDLVAGKLKDRLMQSARRLNLHCETIRVWHAGRMANAAVVGLLPGRRQILLSEELIERLTGREVEAVVLHELAHIVRRHTLWRTLVLFPPLAAWLLYQECFPHGLQLAEPLFKLDRLTLPQDLVLTAGFVLYAIAALAFISRLLEHDADLVAAKALSEGGTGHEDRADRTDLMLALKKLDRRNAESGSRPTWLHPSVRRRVALLRLVAVRPDRKRRFDTRLRAVCVCLALCPLLTAAILIGRELLR